jgi:L-ascorbate metabolism protein UlaG (beta-lactamase superfamily)
MNKTIKKILKRTMYIILAIVLLITVSVMLFLQNRSFGKYPEGERLKKITASPNFKDGKFQNLSPTPDLSEGVTYYGVLKEFMFGRNKRNIPTDSLPSVKVDLMALAPDSNVLVWFGHSSYFMQIDGKKILVDPVLSGAASPVSFTTRSFKGSDVYSVDEIPAIDYLLISHDHWDHLDYQTILALKSRVGKVICGLGVGAHLEYWGYDTSRIIEKDWGDEVRLDDGFVVNLTPARHFSGRGLSRNRSLWTSFVLTSPHFRIYIGGDSGYDKHFKEIGEKFGPFDLALLECGQYDKSWKYIHMMPEEVVQAALDLKAKKLMPVHWAKFALGNHAWDDPILRVISSGRAHQLPLVTPLIGEALNLAHFQEMPEWWQKMR